MGKADALALDDVDAHRRRVEQQVNNVVIEQVDFVHIEHAAVGRSQDARLEVLLTRLDGLLDVERADDAIFSGADGQVDERRLANLGRQRVIVIAGMAVIAPLIRPLRVTVVAAAGQHGDVRQ